MDDEPGARGSLLFFFFLLASRSLAAPDLLGRHAQTISVVAPKEGKGVVVLVRRSNGEPEPEPSRSRDAGHARRAALIFFFLLAFSPGLTPPFAPNTCSATAGKGPKTDLEKIHMKKGARAIHKSISNMTKKINYRGDLTAVSRQLRRRAWAARDGCQWRFGGERRDVQRRAEVERKGAGSGFCCGTWLWFAGWGWLRGRKSAAFGSAGLGSTIVLVLLLPLFFPLLFICRDDGESRAPPSRAAHACALLFLPRQSAQAAASQILRSQQRKTEE